MPPTAPTAERRHELQEQRLDALADPSGLAIRTMSAVLNDRVMTEAIDKAGIHRLSGDSRPVIFAGQYALVHRFVSFLLEVSKARRGPNATGVSVTEEDARKVFAILRVPPPIEILGGVGVKVGVDADADADEEEGEEKKMEVDDE
jgi:hypothetical protein